MADTYCGKSCTDCSYAEALGCPGCQVYPGRGSSDCTVAKCCTSKGHDACETCGFNTGCDKLRWRENIPQDRLRMREAEAQRKVRLEQKVEFLGKWLWLLFLLVIPSTIAGFMTEENLLGSLPAANLVGQVLNLACSIAYGVILLKLDAEHPQYKTAGICFFISAGLSAVSTILSGGSGAAWTLIITLPAAVVSLIGERNEYAAHSEVVRELDTYLSYKWEKLWKWYMMMFAVSIGGSLAAIIVPVLALLAVLAAVIGLAVVSIMKLVYLYRTAKLFRNYTP